MTAEKWTSIGLEGENIIAVAVNPCAPSTILAASAFSFSDGVPGRIFRSTDCGETWENVWTGARASVTRIIFDPANPQTIYANPHGVIRSEDGGKTWRDASDGIGLDFYTRVISLVASSESSPRLYAGTGGFGAGWLYYSDDGGRRWAPVPGDPYDEAAREYDDSYLLDGNVLSLLAHPFNPDEIWAGIGRYSHLLRSTDQGLSWTRVNIRDGASGTFDIQYAPGLHSIFVMILRHGIFRKSNTSDKWMAIEMPDSLKHEFPGMVFTGPNDRIVVATGGGVFQKIGSQWQSLNDNLPHRHIKSITKSGPSVMFYN